MSRGAGGAEARADLFRWPVLGALLRARGTRLAAQIALGALALLLVIDGLGGPQLAPRNLATPLVWVHYRGVLVLVLLVAGNLLCYACPMVLARDLVRRVVRPRWEWPRALRGKWIAVALLVAVLFGYELFDWWSSPRATAFLIVAYFAAAIAVDALFRRAAFCKWVCPVGQFNFVASTASPLEVRAADAAVCGGCATKDCIRGRRDATGALARRGCELALFLPHKHGNLDCTFCLDCVHACPHDNVALAPRLPASELWRDRLRSGIGRLARRTDFAALVAVFTFGALLNAFGMVSPVHAVQRWMADALGWHSEAGNLAALFGVALVAEPLVLLGLASFATARALARRERVLAVGARYVWSLAPLGFGVWLAHYAFHFLTGLWTFVPVAQRRVAETMGTPLLGEPLWSLGGLPERVVQPIEHGLLVLGLVGSWLTAWHVAEEHARERAARAFAPWAVLATLLFAAAVWVLAQPMEMRATALG